MPKKKNPPSKKGQGKKKDKKGKGIPNQKEEKKTKIKIDKTFGMKNKKGRSNAQYVQNMKKNMAATDRRKKKSRNESFKDQQKLQSEFWGDGGGIGVVKKKIEGNTKEILCEFFKQGKCTKGFRCKFSHDLLIERKVEQKKKAAAKEAALKKTMDDMTQMELEDTIRRKMRARDNQTDIVCNYFLDALERRIYGMRWKCPNGVECKYRHALPKGWKLKSNEKKESIVRESLEETLENMRKEFLHRTDLTPVTAETFAAWKIKRSNEDAEEAQRKIIEATQKKKKLTKAQRQLSGRQLFEKFSYPNEGDVDVKSLEKDLPQVDENMEFDESLFVDDEPEPATVSHQQTEKVQVAQKATKAEGEDMEFDESLFMEDF